MFFLLSADKNRYNFLFNQLRDEENIDRDEYPVTITSVIDISICTEGSIRGNQKSTHKNNGGRGGHNPKVRMGNTFSQKRQGGTKENSMLVLGRDGTALN